MWQEIIKFWFEELEESQWYDKDAALDEEIIKRFSVTHTQATMGELWSWRSDAQGSLAEIIVLDQFSRNMYRGSKRSFAFDPLALALAQSAIDKGQNQNLPAIQCAFLYMPFMHSESPAIHEHAVRLFTQLGNAKNLEFEYKHKAIIDRFGRYPHRNDVLGRKSSNEEVEFLKSPGSSF